MKNIAKVFLISGLLMVGTYAIAQNPPHPNGGGAPGSGNTPVGGGAPVGEGIVLLMSLAMGYLGKKTYNLRKK